MVERKVKSRTGRVITRAAAALVVTYLVYFHALLFWQRVLSDSLFRPAVALRWLATAVLLVVMLKLLRAGVPLIRGRRAAGFWLVVILLHSSFFGPLSAEAPIAGAELPVEIFLSLPAVLAAAVIVIAVSGYRRQSKTRTRDVLFSLLHRNKLPSSSYALRDGVLPSLSCRPPPSV